MFPTLSADEMARLRRFATPRRYADGELLARTGEVSAGFSGLVSGQVRVTQRDGGGRVSEIVTHGPGSFLGELAQLSGKPALVDATAIGEVEALIVPPERLRALLIGEAELGEKVMRALILRRVGLLETGAGGPVIIGRPDHPDVLRLDSFLSRNGYPHTLLNPRTDADSAALMERMHPGDSDTPIVLCPNGDLLQNPPESVLARCLGMVAPIDPAKLYDVAVVGAGPAGLAACVYAASEGLSVLALDCRAFGGQAGASARIENYLGFPTGISGLALMARASTQAQKFGAEIAIPDEVTALEAREGEILLPLANGETARARTTVIASGARYRKLDCEHLAEFEAASVHYWASPLEAKLCAGQEVVLVGAGNSAGQATVYLASQVKKVWMIVRGAGLEASMSKYLIDRIKGLGNVELVTGAEVCRLTGQGGMLEQVSWRPRKGGEETTRAISHLFLFIGADPNTDWLASSGVALDSKGFVQTGAEISSDAGAFATNLPGVFAVGDVRCGSVKRVAAAVGEGSQVVSALHQYLARPPPGT
ncbi:MAG: thioredoxin reductase [Caulobacteraceae bacterium]|nr:thioredoxin reductase [Caulobacteraceae bacterium]